MLLKFVKYGAKTLDFDFTPPIGAYLISKYSERRYASDQRVPRPAVILPLGILVLANSNSTAVITTTTPPVTLVSTVTCISYNTRTIKRFRIVQYGNV